MSSNRHMRDVPLYTVFETYMFQKLYREEQREEAGHFHMLARATYFLFVTTSQKISVRLTSDNIIHAFK